MPLAGQGSAPKQEIAEFRSDGVTAASGLRIPFFSDSFSRNFGFPETRLQNMITEATPLREERPYAALVGLREIRYSRPGLVTGFNVGTGPIRGVFRAPPLLGGFLIAVSGTSAYRLDTGASLGVVGGSGPIRYAFSRLQIVLISDGRAYLYDATTLGAFVQIVSATLPPVLDVVYLGTRFVYALVGSDTFYWSEPNDAANIDGLSFATAESYPDNIVGMAIWANDLVIFGDYSTETWQVTGDSASPFAPIVGRYYERGAACRDAISFTDNALFWVGENRVVYRTEQNPVRISSNSIEDRLRQCSDISSLTAYTVSFEGHELYILNVPGQGTFAYDASRIGVVPGSYADSATRGEWATFSSFNRTKFQGSCGFMVGSTVYIGDDTSNDVWQMQVGAFSDGGKPMIRTASAFIKVEEGSPRCNNIVLHCVMGVGNRIDPGSNPMVEMRYSDDQGRTFCPWRAASLGLQGGYAKRAFWQRLDQMRAPGRLVEIRCSEPVNVVFSHLELNAARPAN